MDTSNQKKKILVADDDKQVLSLLSLMLEGAGFEVFSTQKGKEVFELAKRSRPDLIILDVVMPDMLGGDVSQELSGDRHTSNIPIIFLSGMNTQEDEEIMSKLEGKYYALGKPFTRDKLLKTVSKILSR